MSKKKKITTSTGVEVLECIQKHIGTEYYEVIDHDLHCGYRINLLK